MGLFLGKWIGHGRGFHFVFMGYFFLLWGGVFFVFIWHYYYYRRNFVFLSSWHFYHYRWCFFFLKMGFVLGGYGVYYFSWYFGGKEHLAFWVGGGIYLDTFVSAFKVLGASSRINYYYSLTLDWYHFVGEETTLNHVSFRLLILTFLGHSRRSSTIEKSTSSALSWCFFFFISHSF